jgi:uncharacterized protein (DUF362 family)
MSSVQKRIARIALVKTMDRATGIAQAIDLLKINPVANNDVLIKPNFNTADEFPGSTHNDTLKYLIQHVRQMGAAAITIGDRSGPADTDDVIREKGVDVLCRDLGVKLLNFQKLPPDGWVRIKPEKSHWVNGFEVARPILDAGCVVATCCLKTHGYGATFTMSLKLAVGLTHKKNMAELHSSFRSMRKMIAEINQAYTPSLIVLDGIEAFVDGGPMTGKRKSAGVILAGTDRIAIDAIGLAILKQLGSNDAMGKKIFEQEQLARAVELGLGISGPEQIEIVTGDNVSSAYQNELQTILMQG